MRARLPFSSVRLRLTLGTVLVLAVSLVVFGGLLRYQVQKDILREIDGDLARYCRFFSERWRPPDTALEFFPGRESPPPPTQARRESRRDGSPGRGRSRRTRPRFLTTDGRPMAPFTEEGPWDKAAFLLSARDGQEVYSTILAGDEPMRVLSVPLLHNGRISGVLQAARPLAELNWAIGRLTRTLLTFIPLILLIAAVGGAFMIKRTLRPVRHITQAAGRIRAQDLSKRLPVAGGDEFAELASTFNGMLERLEEAFDQQRRFTSDASHELRTPLAAIKVQTSLALQGERSAAQYRQALVAADRAADTATRIVQDLLLLARSDTGRLDLRRTPIRVTDVLLRAVESIETLNCASRERCGSPPIAPMEIVAPDPSVTVAGDAHHLTRLFTNLLENAARHTPPDGHITVTIAAAKDDEAVTVEVADTGEGIAPEHLEKVTERFYRVDESRTRSSGGTGLGLSICQTIVAAHGGSLAIESEVGEGTLVRVTLPRAVAASEGQTPFISPMPSSGGVA